MSVRLNTSALPVLAMNIPHNLFTAAAFNELKRSGIDQSAISVSTDSGAMIVPSFSSHEYLNTFISFTERIHV